MFFGKRGKQVLGIVAEHAELPPSVSEGASVLDVGAGNGVIAERIRDTFHCNVYALEPGGEATDSDYAACVRRLGSGRVENLTLQKALEVNPEKYAASFDVVTVYKYNIPFSQKEEFIKCLSRTVKPNGVVYVTSVERERFYADQSDFRGTLYLTDLFNKYFGSVSIRERQSIHGGDLLMICRAPRPEPRQLASMSLGSS